MAKKKSAGINKSQVIRDYMAANPEAKPKDVAAALTAEHGVSFTPQAVSMTKSNDKKAGKKKPGKRGPKPLKKPIHVGNPLHGDAFNNGLVAIEAAGALLMACGSVETAHKTLEAIARVAGFRTGNG
ncbi:hypothetical protein [Anatilimnocola floriformis]|uniref:hypothetical protein n=1 Tax=Anatilimnocola floriformis TaxID=2948575 RepID=UPI0020C2E4F2|nr:hypothetical protein [Anatilimnocola floriformis]